MTDPAPTKTIHFCSDEWMLLLEALHCYKDTNDGRTVAGHLNWVRAKLDACRAFGVAFVQEALTEPAPRATPRFPYK